MRSELRREAVNGLFYAGDILTGPKTVVQAVASGKNAALEIDAYLKGKNQPIFDKPTKSYYVCLVTTGYRFPWKLNSLVADHFPIPSFRISFH